MAAERVVPRRLGLFFWGNGVTPDRWKPGEVGTLTQPLPPQLAPLEPVRSAFSVVTGSRVTIPNVTTHLPGPGGLLTGLPLRTDASGSLGMDGGTLDQLVAAHVGGTTAFRSLEVAVEPGITGLSQAGYRQPSPAESSPQALFARLFGAGLPGGAPGQSVLDPRWQLRQSVLDAVTGDIARLGRGLGSADRQRLDRHLTSVRELEERLDRLSSAEPAPSHCAMPAQPGAFHSSRGAPPLDGITRAMADVTAMALACDLTRVFSLWYSSPASDVLFPGFDTGHHQLTHTEPGDQPGVDAIVTRIMSDLSAFLQALDAVDEGERTLLQNCGILATTDCNDGRTHGIEDYPMLLCGSMGGALRMGEHVRLSANTSAARVALTLAQQAGAPLTLLGDAEHGAQEPVSELLA